MSGVPGLVYIGAYILSFLFYFSMGGDLLVDFALRYPRPCAASITLYSEGCPSGIYHIRSYIKSYLLPSFYCIWYFVWLNCASRSPNL
jgi:hypothetical protein